MESRELIDAILSDLRRTLQQVDAAQIEAMHHAIFSAKRIFIAGKGRSGLQMKAFAMRLMHLGFTVHVVDDVTTPALAVGDPAADRIVIRTHRFAIALHRNRKGN